MKIEAIPPLGHLNWASTSERCSERKVIKGGGMYGLRTDRGRGHANGKKHSEISGMTYLVKRVRGTQTRVQVGRVRVNRWSIDEGRERDTLKRP